MMVKENPIQQWVTFIENLHVLGSYNNSAEETEAWREEGNETEADKALTVCQELC